MVAVETITQQAEKTPSMRKSSVVDIFCGAGGLSHGFYQEGFDIAVGVDADENCRYAFEYNNCAPFIRRDVAKLKSADVSQFFINNRLKVLIGCAPCQPFSRYNQKNNDPQWNLLNEFGRLVHEVKPEIVSMENVPRLVKFHGGTVFENFVTLLQDTGYWVQWGFLSAPDFGLPQNRLRLVLLASRLGAITLPEVTHQHHKTVREAIAKLPKLKAGEVDERDPLHRSARLSPTNLKRIMSSKPGGTWQDWDEEMIADCHKKDTGKSYRNVYGRMQWDAPSPTITTQYYGFGNGRFGHPEQNRAISLREGAILQGFPKDYAFTAPGQPVHFKTVGRLVGNAVPVKLAEAIAHTVKEHIRRYG